MVGKEGTADPSTKDEADKTPLYEGKLAATQDQFEDEDAAVYRRAKAAVDELHRARKFEKSIKLR